MTRASPQAGRADELEYSAEKDAPVPAWNLDELDESSDLASVRLAYGRTDEPG